MKTTLVTAVQRALGSGLARLTPAFVPAGEDLPTAFGLYHADLSEDLRAYIMFQAHRKKDSFTVEVACTRNSRWPAFYLRTPKALDELSEDGDIRFRLAMFWGEQDYWWPVTSESVEAAVTDVADRLERYALPYFGAMARKAAGPPSA